jgi:membrane-anchored protein YejM (alkaline phosphatase superfamily)
MPPSQPRTHTGPITHNESLQIDELFRNRWRSLLSVDDIIAEVVSTLEAANALNDTYIFLTSDHGYQVGCVLACGYIYIYIYVYVRE